MRVIKDKILVKEIKNEPKEGEFVIENPENPNQIKCEVLAVGNGYKDEPMEVKVGDKLIFHKSNVYKIKEDGEEYYIISQSQVLTILD